MAKGPTTDEALPGGVPPDDIEMLLVLQAAKKAIDPMMAAQHSRRRTDIVFSLSGLRADLRLVVCVADRRKGCKPIGPTVKTSQGGGEGGAGQQHQLQQPRPQLRSDAVFLHIDGGLEFMDLADTA
jgi:hypothetical protein